MDTLNCVKQSSYQAVCFANFKWGCGPGHAEDKGGAAKDNTAVSDIPRGTLRLSQNRHLSEDVCDQVLFDFVSFIQLPQETKVFVSIIGVISVVKYITNSLKF